MPTKVDLKRDLGALYKAKRSPGLVDVPELQFLMVDGSGDPNSSQEWADAIQALFSLSYTLKFMLKPEYEYSVMPLEGLWWDESGFDFMRPDRSQWGWRAMIAQPDAITDELLEQAREKAAEKVSREALDKVRLERFEEGRAVQVMHVGPYSEERPTIEGLHAFAADQGLKLRGEHHEIYLGDPRRSAPERLKTIIRQPVE